MGDILAADFDGTAGDVVVVDQQLCQGGLAAARIRRPGPSGSLRHLQRDAVKDFLSGALVIGEMDVLQADVMVRAAEGGVVLLCRGG